MHYLTIYIHHGPMPVSFSRSRRAAVNALRAAVLRRLHIISPSISGRLGNVFRDAPITADMPANRRETPSRAYKACLSCRKRKIRCNLGPSNQAPCQRCQRESRDCIVPEERSWKRQHETPRRGPSSNTGFEPSFSGHDGASPSNVASRAQQDSRLEAETCSTSAPARASNAGLENTIVTTTVTNGNDALGLLFSDIRSGQTTTASDLVNGGGAAPTSAKSPWPRNHIVRPLQRQESCAPYRPAMKSRMPGNPASLDRWVGCVHMRLLH